jgi:hypothetical protein
VNWVGFSKEQCLSLSFFMGEEHQLCATQPRSNEWRNTVVLRRKPLMLGGRGSSSLLTIANGACFWREQCLPLSVSMNETTSAWKEHCWSCERTMNLRSKRV